MTEGHSNSPEQNPYEVAQVMAPVAAKNRPGAPGPVAIFFSILLGIAAAIATFGVTFFFTCLGVSSSAALNNGAGGEVIVFGVSGLTAVGAFVFTVWGLLKLVRHLKS